MTKKILVTGGNGMVGRNLKQILPNPTYVSSENYNLTSENDVSKMFQIEQPDIIIHLAAKVGGIIDNIKFPAEYFTDNVLMNTLLLKYAKSHGVSRFIGILSTCSYPDNVLSYPMGEDALHYGPPTITNLSYGYAKRCLAVQIDSYNKQYGTKYNYLIPSNLYGEYDKTGNNSHFVTALINKIHKAKINNQKEIILFGTGQPLRQFLYVSDLCNVIKYCVDNDITDSFNVATTENVTISEIANIALRACDATDIQIVYDSTKPDGQYRKDVSINKLLSIYPDFTPLSLFDGIKQTYQWLINQ
jgi:GDP-L-fucose synthase